MNLCLLTCRFSKSGTPNTLEAGGERSTWAGLHEQVSSPSCLLMQAARSRSKGTKPESQVEQPPSKAKKGAKGSKAQSQDKEVVIEPRAPVRAMPRQPMTDAQLAVYLAQLECDLEKCIVRRAPLGLDRYHRAYW